MLCFARVAQGEPEEACAVVGQVLDATSALASVPVPRQLTDLAGALTPYREQPKVAAQLARIRDSVRQRSWLVTWIGDHTSSRSSTEGDEDNRG